MEYLTQQEFKKMMLLAWQRIEENKEEINKINVFPVPDQDTGSNMAQTLLGIKEAIENREFKNLDEISEATLEGALTAAQGNAGVIYTGFLAGFLPLLNRNPVNAKKLAEAFRKGAERARLSIQNPKEGTILDVIDAAAFTFEKKIAEEMNITAVWIRIKLSIILLTSLKAQQNLIRSFNINFSFKCVFFFKKGFGGEEVNLGRYCTIHNEFLFFLSKKGLHNKAIENCNKVLELDPDNSLAPDFAVSFVA